MDKAEFLKQQYITLREEIKETKARIFKIIGFGIVVVPTAHFFAQAYKLDIVTLSMPILVIVVTLLYLSENHALMRCGRYIRKHIEPEAYKILGWETWLEIPDPYDRRTVDKYLSYCFYLLFIVYYVSTVFMSARFAQINFGSTIFTLILGFYISIGIWFLIFLIKNIRRLSTTTLPDQMENPPSPYTDQKE